ncbi:MAG: FAD-dependent thymidylate synthase [Synergistaceae bacterium]|nr:FAD-dependent thymidylate synthase [Synergistaceae bacterium]
MALDVKLIAHTTEPVRVVAAAAKLCYSASPVSELFEGLDETSISHLLSILRESRHMSPFEHASFTYALEGVSRVATHQLVRHRIASYSQRSQRYVSADGARCVIPPEVEDIAEARAIFEEYVKKAHDAYERMTALGVPGEDARFILPHGVETSIVVTMNARELRHFFELRLCRRAQWEIREVARRMLVLAYDTAGELFHSAGPPCVTGVCAEYKSCEKPYGNTEEVMER